MPVWQWCTVATSEKSWWDTGQSQIRHTNSWFLAATKAPKVFGFHTHTVALCSVGQSSILSAKFDCPVAQQDFSLLATVHDCETVLSREFLVQQTLAPTRDLDLNSPNLSSRNYWLELGELIIRPPPPPPPHTHTHTHIPLSITFMNSSERKCVESSNGPLERAPLS